MNDFLTTITSSEWFWVVVGALISLLIIVWRTIAKQNNIPVEPIETMLENAKNKAEEQLEQIQAAETKKRGRKPAIPQLTKDVIDKDAVVYNINKSAIKIINIEGRNYEVLDDYTLIPFNSHKS